MHSKEHGSSDASPPRRRRAAECDRVCQIGAGAPAAEAEEAHDESTITRGKTRRRGDGGEEDEDGGEEVKDGGRREGRAEGRRRTTQSSRK